MEPSSNLQPENLKTEVKFKPTSEPSKKSRGRFYADDVSRHAVTIGIPQEQVFAFWRNLKNLSYFMKDVKNISVISDNESHWVLELKNGYQVEWDAVVVSERQNEMITWKSVEGSDIETSGSVWFSPAPAGRGTVVSLILDYKILGGKLTELATLFTLESPDALAHINLRRLKAFLETGEVPTIEGQPSGREEGAPDEVFQLDEKDFTLDFNHKDETKH